MRIVLACVAVLCLIFAAFALIFAAVIGADGRATFPNLLLHGPFLTAIFYAAMCGAARRALKLLDDLTTR